MLSFFLRHVAGDKGAQDPCPDMQVPQVNNGCAAACLAEVSKHSQVPVCASSKERGMKGVCVCESVHAWACASEYSDSKDQETLPATLSLSYTVTD